RPDWVVAQGDTTSTLAASMAAFYRQVPFLHVEAGLRTNDLTAPWPEEFHRRVTALATTVHCAPTARAVESLRAEGVPAESIHLTGNTIVDALQHVLTHPFPPLADGPARRFLDTEDPLVLITGHRRENFGPGLESICRAIHVLAETFTEHKFIYAVHLNPAVRQTVDRLLGEQGDTPSNIHLIDPPIYPEFVRLMVRSTLILSDSGGIQEETPTLGKPLLILRETTERPEAVEAGTAVLVGTDTNRIVDEASELLRSAERRAAFENKENPFGDGHAAKRIAVILEEKR
ncbi:MAG: UDP-N-acetylglucosamine 2-epimerase (non-hydrolyzing), partial [Planctomycetia bacterium]